MMSLKVLHAGDGYAYLTKQVATGDHPRTRGELMADYYTAHGMPAGQWWGKGAEILGVSGEVTEEQMQASFGEFLRPDANDRIKELIVSGKTAEEAITEVRLGAKPYDFNRDIPFMVALKEQTIEFTQANRRVPTAEEKEDLEQIVARRILESAPPSMEDTSSAVSDVNLAWESMLNHETSTSVHAEMSLAAPTLCGGRKAPVTSERIKAFIAQEKSRARYPVSGYDMVFTPQKSVSVLWGIGDEQTRKAIMRAHSEAVESALHWIEDTALYTRAGKNGIKKVDCDGAVIAKYVHWDNRAGDPNLHTHCPILNRVHSEGKWRTIDGQVLHRAAVSASEHYNQQITQRVAAALPGVTFEPVVKSRGGRPVWEIKGIPDELMTKMSRRDDVLARGRELIEDYRAKYGRSPSKATQYKLMEQANLETRSAKGEARSLQEMVTEWREIANTVSEDFDLDSILTDVFAETEWIDKPGEGASTAEWDAWRAQEATRRHTYSPTDDELIAARVMDAVARDRPVWTEFQVTSEINRQLTAYEFSTDEQREQAAERLQSQCLAGHCVAVDRHREVPDALTRRSGESVYVAHGSIRYTSTQVLDAEKKVTDAAGLWLVNEHTTEVLDELTAQFATDKGYQLSADKRAFVEHLLCSPAALAVGVGAAGTGKTTAMEIFARAWESTGNKVIGLAPSAVAAQVLGESLGVESATLAKFIDPHSELPPQMQPGQGDVILIDEAGMASTLDLAAVVTRAEEVGALVRMVGDPQQLASIESGGMLGELAEATDAPSLTEIHRFTDAAEADISLRLRDGDTGVIDWYERHGRISSGLREHLPAEVFDAWIRSRANGKTALMIAGDRGTVDTLNQMARAHYIATNTVDPTAGQARIFDGRVAAVGDTIVTRKNESRLRYGHHGKHRVKNGDLWTVTAVDDDGGLVVTHASTGHQVTLPAEYVTENVELGYASTIYRSQGQTVDHAFVLPSASLDRQGMYVAMTRGRELNRMFVPDDQIPDLDSHIDQAQPMTPREFIETIIQRDGAAVTAHAALAAAEEDNLDITTTRLAYTDLVEDMAVELAVACAPDAETAGMLRADWQTRRLAMAIGNLDHAGADTDAALRGAIVAAKARWDTADEDKRGSLAFLVRMELENNAKATDVTDEDLLWTIGAPLPPLRETDTRSRVFEDEELYDFTVASYALVQENLEHAGDTALADGADWIDQIGQPHPDDREFHAVWQRAVRAVAAAGVDPRTDLSDIRSIDNPELQRRLTAVDAAERRRGRDPFEGLDAAQLRRYIAECTAQMDRLTMLAATEDQALDKAEGYPETTTVRAEWTRTVEQAERITAYRAAEQAAQSAQAEYKQAMASYQQALDGPRFGRAKRLDAAQAVLGEKKQAVTQTSAAQREASQALPAPHTWDHIVALAGNEAEWAQRVEHATAQDDRAYEHARSRVDRREAELSLWAERKQVAESLVEQMRPASPERKAFYLQRMREQLAAQRAARAQAAGVHAHDAADASDVSDTRASSESASTAAGSPTQSEPSDQATSRPSWRERMQKYRTSDDGRRRGGSNAGIPEQSVDQVVAGVLSDVRASAKAAGTTTATYPPVQVTEPESTVTTEHTPQEGPDL